MSDIIIEKNMDEIDSTVENTVSYDNETIIWEGRPSQWVNLGTYIWWIIFLLFPVFFLMFWYSDLKNDYDSFIGLAVQGVCYTLIFLSMVSIIYAYLSVFYEKTTISYNKIKESKGITSIFRQDLFCEISDITDIKSPPAGLLGLFGLSTLVIETNDNDQPVIKIRAIKDRESLITQLLPVWRRLKMERKGYFGD